MEQIRQVGFLFIFNFMIICLCSEFRTTESEWGFYGHRLINRMAVFTLPPDLIELYKAHLDYISDHAVDPDKRRYAVKQEAICHYIDLDEWIKDDSSTLSTDLVISILQFSKFKIARDKIEYELFDSIPTEIHRQDTLWFSKEFINHHQPANSGIAYLKFRELFYSGIWVEYDPENWKMPLSILNLNLEKEHDSKLFIEDHFTRHGILPYNFVSLYYKLVHAFEKRSLKQILRYSADLGHYLGDAHVPLHTTKNYNGQLTNQDGIHGFWESRIPELFAESEFDFVVGSARYIPDITGFIWNIIYDSHAGVEFLLKHEEALVHRFPKDQQFCYESRNGMITKLPCKEYSWAYMEKLDGQVERQMQKSILNLGSVWMSAWIEAGQVDVNLILDSTGVDKQIPPDTVVQKLDATAIRAHE